MWPFLTLIGWISPYGGLPSAISSAVIPVTQHQCHYRVMFVYYVLISSTEASELWILSRNHIIIHCDCKLAVVRIYLGTYPDSIYQPRSRSQSPVWPLGPSSTASQSQCYAWPLYPLQTQTHLHLWQSRYLHINIMYSRLFLCVLYCTILNLTLNPFKNFLNNN